MLLYPQQHPCLGRLITTRVFGPLHPLLLLVPSQPHPRVPRFPQDLCDTVRLYPSVLLPPLLLFALLCGLGVWGVLCAAQDHADNNRREALSVARDAVASFKVPVLPVQHPRV